MTLTKTQATALAALRTKKAHGLAVMYDAERASYKGLGLTKTERADMIGHTLEPGSWIAGVIIPGASYRTLRALVNKGACKMHKASDGRAIVYAVA